MLTREGCLTTRGIFERDRFQSIAHMELLLWNFFLTRWMNLPGEIQLGETSFSPYFLDIRRIWHVRRFVSWWLFTSTIKTTYIRNQRLMGNRLILVSPKKFFLSKDPKSLVHYFRKHSMNFRNFFCIETTQIIYQSIRVQNLIPNI